MLRVKPLAGIRRLEIEVTNKCNTSCVFCPRGELKAKQGFMNINDVLQVITNVRKEASKYGGLKLVNIGSFGEPLLYPLSDLLRVIRYCKYMGIKSRISTNAELLTESTSSSFLEAGLDYLNISVDDIDKDRFEKLRPGLHWETVRDNSINFYTKKVEGNYRTRVIIYPVDCVENHKYINDIIRYWRQYSDSCHASRELPLDRNRTGRWLISGTSILYRHIAGLAGFMSPTHCHDWMVVKLDGTVVPCCLDYFTSMPLGNIFKQSVSEIFNGKPANELRSAIVCGEAPDLCQYCIYLGMMR